MSNVSQWDNSAANNNSAPPNGWPEGQAPSTVNDCAREVMAAVSRWFDDTKGELVTGGTGNAYTLATNNANAALADQGMLVFRCNRANTGAATLNVDTLGAKAIELGNGALAAGMLQADVIYTVVYNATADTYDLVNALTLTQLGAGSLATKSTINNADWSGTDLAIANGGTGSSTAGDARTALSVPLDDLSDADFSAITTISGFEMLAADNFLVDDGGVTKRMRHQDAGFFVTEVSGTTDTLADTNMTKILAYTSASGVAITLNTGTGVKGNWIGLHQQGAGQLTVSGTATLHAPQGTKTRTQYSTLFLVNKGSDVWFVTGDATT